MYLCNMKAKLDIDWKKFLVFFIVIGGLIFITKSILMTIGIVMLLLVIDRLIADWEENRKWKKEHEQDDSDQQ